MEKLGVLRKSNENDTDLILDEYGVVDDKEKKRLKDKKKLAASSMNNLSPLKVKSARSQDSASKS